MARFVYAKVYCDILRHPLFRSRPDFETKLVLGLILEAKEHTEDGVLRKLTAEDARALCYIKASTAKVQEAIDYLVAVGWLIPHPDLAYEIKDFVPRQAADSPAERASRWRDAHLNERVTKRDENPERQSNGCVTKRDASVTSALADGEEEEEVEKEDQEQKALSGLQANPPASRSAAREVFEHWKQRMGKRKNTVFGSTREGKVRARLREGYTVAELKQAIDGCAASGFHAGDNPDGKVWNDLELICRNATKTDGFIALVEQQQAPPVRLVEHRETDSEIEARILGKAHV